MTNGIRYFGGFAPNGVGYAARGYLRVLEELGYGYEKVRAVAVLDGVALDDFMNPYIDNESHLDVTFTTQITHCDPVRAALYIGAGEVKHNILITYWETNQLPQRAVELIMPMTGQRRRIDCVDALKAYDEIWVPSRFTQSVFEDAGLKARLVPHVLPPEILKLKGATFKHTNKTRILNVGTWDGRKNTGSLLHAYFKTGWTLDDSTHLHMHMVPSRRDREAVHAHARFAAERMSVIREQYTNNTMPGFTTSTIELPFEEMVKMHVGSNVFATASRGESACYDAIIAAALGNYVIGGGGPALEDIKEVVPHLVKTLPWRYTPVIEDPLYPYLTTDQDWFDVPVPAITEAFLGIKELIEKSTNTKETTAAMDHYSPESVAAGLKDWSPV